MTLSLQEQRLLQQCFRPVQIAEPLPFSELKISVSTYLVKFDTQLDLETIFWNIPTLDIPLQTTSKNESIQVLTIGPPGSVLTAKYKNHVRGNIPPGKGAFRNQVTLVMSLEDKNVNLFVFKDSLKVAGITKPEQIIPVTHYFLSHLQKIHCYYDCYERVPVVINFGPAMTNTNFQLGFNIDREALDQYLLQNGCISIFEPSANSGLYWKIPRKDNPMKHHTFTIFFSGCVLVTFTGDDREEMEKIYHYVCHTLISHKNLFEKNFY